MNEVALQIMLILAYLVIGLISVTFPIYAISVNFLPQQKWETEKEREKRKSNLRTKINQLSAQLGGQATETDKVSKMREELDKYEAELQGTELRYQYLTVRGAVAVPISLLIVALFLAGLGIYGFYIDSLLGVEFFGTFSAAFSLMAIFRLYKTLSAVEYGALKPERTVQFEVGFGKSSEKTLRAQLNNLTKSVCFFRPERDVDSLYATVYFPSELGVTEKINLISAATPGITLSEYEDSSVFTFEIDFLPKGKATGFSFQAIPKKTGRHSVEVRICAKGIYEYNEELTIEVV